MIFLIKRVIFLTKYHFTGVGSIENLQVSEDNFVVTTEWDVPENSELCELTYLVEYTDGPLVYLHVTVDTMFIFELQNCGPYRVTVTPFDITGVHGEEREVTGNTGNTSN